MGSALRDLMAPRRVQGEGAMQRVLGWVVRGGMKSALAGSPDTPRSSFTKAAVSCLELMSRVDHQGWGSFRASLPSDSSAPSWPGSPQPGDWGLLVLPGRDSPDPLALTAALPSLSTHPPACQPQEMTPGLPAGLVSCTPLPWFPGPGPSFLVPPEFLEGTGFWPQGSWISSFTALPSSRSLGLQP